MDTNISNRVLIIVPHPDDEINVAGQVIVDFLKSDLTDYLESDNCKKQMEYLNVQDETSLKLATLKIYEGYFSDEEHQKWYDYIIKSAKKSPKKKLVQENFPTL